MMINVGYKQTNIRLLVDKQFQCLYWNRDLIPKEKQCGYIQWYMVGCWCTKMCLCIFKIMVLKRSPKLAYGEKLGDHFWLQVYIK